MGDIKLQGASGAFYTEQAVNVRKIKEGVSNEEISKAIHNNNLDEVVVEDAKGQKFIAYADELSVEGGEMPKVGDKVSLPFVEGEATVTHVDNEYNEQWTNFLSGGIIGSLLNKTTESDQAIQEISEQLTFTSVPQESVDWATQIEAKAKEGYQATPEEKERYGKIYSKIQIELKDKIPLAIETDK